MKTLRNSPGKKRLAALGICVSALLAATPEDASAATRTWLNTGTDYNTGANWTGGQVPTSSGSGFAAFVDPAVTNPNLSADAPAIVSIQFLGTTASGYTLSADPGFIYTLTNSTASAGTIRSQATSGTNTISAGISLTGALANFDQDSGGTLELSGAITTSGSFTGPVLFRNATTGSNAGHFILSGTNNDFNGAPISIRSSGTVSVTKLSDAGGGGSLGTGRIELGNVNSANNRGTLNYVGTGGATDQVLQLGGFNQGNLGGSVLSNGSGALVWTGAVTSGTGTGSRSLTLGGANTGNNEIQSAMANNPNGGGALSVSKIESGKWILSGTNTYTGTTTVSLGTLLANNATSSLGTGVAVVQANATLGGTGRLANSSVTINADGTFMAGDGTSALQSLTLAGNLTLQDDSIVQMTLGPSLESSTLVREGGAWTFDTDQEFVFTLLPGVTTGTYENIITGLAADPNVASWVAQGGAGFTATFSYDGLGNVDLIVSTVPEPGAASLLTGVGIMVLLVRRRCRRYSDYLNGGK